MYPAGLPKLATMDALTEVYRDGDYAIYRVDQSALPTPSFATVTIDGDTTTANPGLGTPSP